jgi:HNH endonuclease
MAGTKGSKTGNGREMRGQPLSVRLSSKCVKDELSDCILWTGTKNNKGYGRLTYEKKQISVHRVAYELANGPIANGLFVLHSCDNPLCVNPEHLSLGNQTENMRQASERGRIRVPRCKGIEQGSSKLSEDDVLKIRESTGTVISVAKEFNVAPSTISSIRLRKSWTHI